MSTTTVGAGVASIDTSAAENTGAIQSEKKTYRKYVKLTEPDAEGKTSVKEFQVLKEKDKKEPAKIKAADGTEVDNPYAGLSVDWAKAERDGFILFNQNDVETYSVKTWDGAELLVPDDSVRLYVFNTGLASLQTSQANAFMKATVEGDSTTPEYNDQTLDLRVGIDGEYTFNKLPSKRGKSELDKLVDLLTAMGVAPDQQGAVIEAMIKAKQVSASVLEAGQEEEEGQPA